MQELFQELIINETFLYNEFENYPKEVLYKETCENICYSTIQIYFKLIPLILLFFNYLILSFFPENKKVLMFSKHLNFGLLLFYAIILIFKVI